MTNADRIRAMTDMELYLFLKTVIHDHCGEMNCRGCPLSVPVEPIYPGEVDPRACDIYVYLQMESQMESEEGTQT